MTPDQDRLRSILTPEQLDEILADIRFDPILIDHHASRLFPKSPEDRLRFRRAIRALLP